MLNKNHQKLLFIVLLLNFSFCGTPKKENTTYKASLQGNGSSFSLPMTSVLFKHFSKLSRINIKYTPDNSFLGINDLIAGTVDFAVSDIYIPDTLYSQNPDILHIPVAVAGINFAYNIPGEDFTLSTDPIYLTPTIISKIFLGEITKWNDPAIVAINQEVAENKSRVFPDLDITVIHRAKEAGDNVLLSTFLTKSVPEWARKIGVTNQINWISTNGQATTLDMMKKFVQTEGAFTYTTMIYGVQNNIPLARVKNYLGVFGRGCNFRSLEAMKSAEPNIDNRIDLTYPKTGRESAVATGFIYMLVKKEQNYNNRTKEQAQNTVNLINWLLSPFAQRELEPIFFASLTPKFRQASKNTLAQMTYNGEPLIPQTITNK